MGLELWLEHKSRKIAQIRKFGQKVGSNLAKMAKNGLKLAKTYFTTCQSIRTNLLLWWTIQSWTFLTVTFNFQCISLKEKITMYFILLISLEINLFHLFQNKIQGAACNEIIHFYQFCLVEFQCP